MREFNSVPPLPPGPEVERAVDTCRQMIRVGSLSFSLASRLLGKVTKDYVFLLYGWCRYCDDQIDQAASLGKDIQLKRLSELKEKTRSALRGEPQTEPVFLAMQLVCTTFRIPEHYPVELLEGMAMDVAGTNYETEKDLELYCYRVAGVVGLMMSHVLGLSDARALEAACSLGSAMQMTNIARDITEDFEMGRVYLPKTWLDKCGLTRSQIKDPQCRVQVAKCVEMLLDSASQHYQSGLKGIQYLSFRSSLAISAAASVYSEIGRLVRNRKEHAWDRRAIVPLWRKVLVIILGLPRVFHLLPLRVARPWKRIEVNEVWRFA